MTKSDGIKMFCFDSPIKCKRAPSVEKILKSFHVDNTCSEDITVAAFMHLTLVFWKLGRNWLLSRSRLFCIYNFSVKWEVLNNVYEKWIQAQAPDSGSRLQDQALGCRSKLRGSRLSIIHTSSAWTRSLEKSWTRFRARGSGSKIHHDYKEAKLSIKIPRLQGGKNLSIVNGLAGPLTLAASFCSA